MKKKLAVLLAALMVVSLFAGCGSSGGQSSEATSSEASQAESTAPAQSSEAAPAESSQAEPAPSAGPINVTYALTNDWNTINFYADAPNAAIYIITDKIFDRMFYMHADGSLTSRNADTWEFNNDNTVLTIHLNPNAKWHDGEPVTAYDWEFTYSTMMNPNAAYAKPSNNHYFVGTDDAGFAVEGEELGVKALDDYTLELSFKQNMVSLEDLLKTTNLHQIPVIPKHILGDLPVDQIYADASYWDAPIGSGPCKFVSQVVNNQIVLDANKDYYLGAPGFDTLTFVKMDTATTLATFESGGDIDVVFPRYSSDNAIEAMSKAGPSGYVAEQDPIPTRVCYMMFNNQNVTDYRIRQAIQYTIDRDALCVGVMNGLADATPTYLTDSNPYKLDIDYTPDLEKAAALLKEAGYDTNNRLTLKMDTNKGFRATIAAYMQQELAKIGIDLEVTTVDAATGFAELADGTVDIGWIVDTAGNGNLSAEWYYTPNAEGSYTKVTDEKLGELMAKIREVQVGDDEAAIQAAMTEFQEYVYEQCPIIPFFFLYGVNAHSARLQGATLEDAAGYNDNVWDWKIAG